MRYNIGVEAISQYTNDTKKKEQMKMEISKKKERMISKLIKEANRFITTEEEGGYYIAREWVEDEKAQWFMLDATNNSDELDEALLKMAEVYGYAKLWNAYITVDDLLKMKKEAK